jgi:UDP-glucose 4-epimerase
VFNLGHPQPLSLRGFADALFDAVGGGLARSVPFPEERARIAIGDVYCSWRKINEALGWEPTTPLREGLRRTVDYYRAHRDRYW